MKRRRKIKKILIVMTSIFVLLFIVFSYIDSRLRPVITSNTTTMAKMLGTRAINDSIANVLAKNSVTYNQLVTLDKDTEGKVCAIETNAVKMNKLRSDITAEVIKTIDNIGTKNISIPLGTLLGNNLFIGRGPAIKIKIEPVGYVISNTTSDFSSAGINQTRHQIMANVKTVITMTVPSYIVSTEVESNVCIAETIIVGAVPNSFTNINGDNRSDIDKINDYANKK
jgi:sporulation protein YunB